MDGIAFVVALFALLVFLGIAVVGCFACAQLDFVAEARIRHAFNRPGGADIDKVERIVGPLDIRSFVGFAQWTADDAIDYRKATRVPHDFLE
jgi:hypothetical protein